LAAGLSPIFSKTAGVSSGTLFDKMRKLDILRA
jgi:hypothetical protein